MKIVRIVNGEKVELKEKDPTRRYSCVNAPEGQYLREFTDEEEQHRNDEELGWDHSVAILEDMARDKVKSAV